MDSKHIVCLGLLIATLTMAACSPKATPKPAATLKLTPTDTPKPTAITEVFTPTVSGGAVPMGFTEDGAPYRGNPDAPVTLVEYSEFL